MQNIAFGSYLVIREHYKNRNHKKYGNFISWLMFWLSDQITAWKYSEEYVMIANEAREPEEREVEIWK